MKQKNTKIKILMLAMLIFFTLGGITKAATIDSEEQAFVDLLNDYRKSLGRMELKISKPVTDGVEFFAQDFADNPDNANVNIHIDTTGNAPEERGQKYGYYFLSENMGWGYETAQAMFDAWKASSGHKENMINAGGRTIGIARVNKPGATKGGASTEWFWVMDLSDEGVERLIGNNLKTSEMYSGNYRKMTVTVKKWNKKSKKYKKLKWAEVKVYDKNTGQLLDHDIADKNGKCALYIIGSSREITIKAAKFKGRTTSKFTAKGKLSSKGKVKSKKTTLKKNIKFELRFK
jgi:hypothetical protein